MNPPAQSSEKLFFEAGHIKITNVRFIVGGQTHVMRNVTSVKSARSKGPQPVLGVVFGLLSVVNFWLAAVVSSDHVGGAVFFWVGALLFLLAAIGSFGAKCQYAVMLTTNSGETLATSSLDESFTAKVIGALNEALIHG